MSAFKTFTLMIAFSFIVGVAIDNVEAQTTQQGSMPQIGSKPTVRPKRKLPAKSKMELKSQPREVITCEALYAKIRNAFDALRGMCQKPESFRGKLFELNSLRAQWAKKNCSERDINPNLKKDAKYILEKGINSTQKKCLNSCYERLISAVKKLQCKDTDNKCLSCCNFLTADQNKCKSTCKSIPIKCEFIMEIWNSEREKDAMRQQAEKTHIKSFTELLREINKLQSESVDEAIFPF